MGELWRQDRSHLGVLLIKAKMLGCLYSFTHQLLTKGLPSTPTRLKYPDYSGFWHPHSKPTPAAWGCLSYEDWQVLAGRRDSWGEPCLNENEDTGKALTYSSAPENWAIPSERWVPGWGLGFTQTISRVNRETVRESDSAGVGNNLIMPIIFCFLKRQGSTANQSRKQSSQHIYRAKVGSSTMDTSLSKIPHKESPLARQWLYRISCTLTLPEGGTEKASLKNHLSLLLTFKGPFYNSTFWEYMKGNLHWQALLVFQ